ncbi:MAG: hypothetical protein AAF204_02405 [Pseudomonadota bacterium]
MPGIGSYGYKLNKDFGFAAKPAEPTQPAQSLLACLSNTKLDTKPVVCKQVPVDPNKPNAKAAAAEQKDNAHAANKENHGKIAAAEKVIKEASGEIIQAAKSAGVDNQLPQRQGEMTGVELVGAAVAGPAASAASMAFAGKGSLATKGASALDTAATFKEMSAGGSTPEEAMSAIQDVLVQSSLSSDGDNFGMLQQANSVEGFQVNRDWGAVFDQHDLTCIADIVAYDPNNPSDAFPEMQELKAAVDTNDAYINEMEDVTVKADQKLAGLDDLAERVGITSMALSDQGFSGLRTSALDTDAAIARLLDRASPALASEPTPAFTQNATIGA